MTMNLSPPVTIIGAGLAGSEAALQLAKLGISSVLYEMRPKQTTAAHETHYCAELVCSNSLGSMLPDRAGGVLMQELEQLNCQLLPLAKQHAVPAGAALAVDRIAFGKAVTEKLEQNSLIKLKRKELTKIPEYGPVIIATGPLTSDSLAEHIHKISGEEHLAFFDAIAPVILAESIDKNVVFKASRYDKGDADYLNIPLSKPEYEDLVQGLISAEKHPLKDFEEQDPKAKKFFERCLPVEVLASRGPESLRFGPLRPVGLNDPRTNRWPYAAIQLRQENAQGNLYNIVGFQTNLTYKAQKKLIRSLPGMENAEFARLGSMHRNTFLNSPQILTAYMQMQKTPRLFFAGQITGMEGYLGNIGSGLVAAQNIAKLLSAQPMSPPPRETLLGSLCYHVSESPAKPFQPMKAEFGLLPPLIPPVKKVLRREAYAKRSHIKMKEFIENTITKNTQPS